MSLKLNKSFNGNVFAQLHPGYQPCVDVEGNFYTIPAGDWTQADVNESVDIEAARAAKITEINTAYVTAIAPGFTPNAFIWTLPADAQADLMGTALDIVVNQMQPTDTVLLPTSHGVSTLSVTEALWVINGFKSWITPLKANLSNKLFAIAQATTIEQIEAIAW